MLTDVPLIADRRDDFGADEFCAHCRVCADECPPDAIIPDKVLVRGEQIIAASHNAPIASHDPTAHAEIAVLRAAGRALGSYRLTDTTLYVTLEPCVMCAAAIVHARVRRLVFGAWDARAGAAGSITNVFALPALNHRVDVFGGVLMDECARLLQEFFAQRRG